MADEVRDKLAELRVLAQFAEEATKELREGERHGLSTD